MRRALRSEPGGPDGTAPVRRRTASRGMSAPRPVDGGGEAFPSSRADAAPALHFGTARGRWLLAAAVLGSGIAFLDVTVVGIALPAIGREFSAGVDALQWVSNAYTLTLAGLL